MDNRDKVFHARLVMKHDVEENWLKATNFVPKSGEIIVYDADGDHTIQRIKIGDGVTNVSALPFQNHMDAEVIAEDSELHLFFN